MKIALTGKMRSGKDTVANYFLYNDEGWSNQIAFGDEIKSIAKLYFPEMVAQGKPREIYQSIGQHFRGIDNDVWVKALDKTMNFLMLAGEDNFVISDVRQMNEYEYLKANDFTVIKIEADDELRKERTIQAGDVFEPSHFYHETEIAVDSIPYDYLITNNDTLEALMQQIKFVHSELKGESNGE